MHFTGKISQCHCQSDANADANNLVINSFAPGHMHNKPTHPTKVATAQSKHQYVGPLSGWRHRWRQCQCASLQDAARTVSAGVLPDQTCCIIVWHPVMWVWQGEAYLRASQCKTHINGAIAHVTQPSPSPPPPPSAGQQHLVDRKV